VGGNRLGDKGQEMTFLLTAGGANGQDPLHKAVPLGTVRAETALPPQHRRAERLFGRIVRRLDARLADERPQRLLVGQQFLAHGLRRVAAPRPLREQPVDRLLDRGHGRLERRPVDGSFPEQVPQPKHQVAQGQEVRAPDPHPPAPVDERLEIAHQMAPAQLVSAGWQCQIGFVPIRPHDASIRRSQQVAQGRTAPTRRHIKQGRDGGHHGPQPAPVAGFLPARFVDVAAVLVVDGGVNRVIDGCQCGAPGLLQGNHAPQADRQSKEIVQQPRHGSITEVVVAVQDGHGRGGARSKGTRRHIGRSFRRDQGATAAAADGMILVGRNLRTYDGDLPHVLDLDGAGVVAHIRQRVVAGRASIGIVIAHMVNMIRVGRGALVARMPGLAAGLPSAFPAHGARWRRWRIGRWRFGRVLRMLIEPRFEVGHPLLKICVLLLEVRKLLLLECEDCQQRVEELSHRQWSGGPILGANPSWWRLQIHRRSMRGIGAAVKSVGSDRVRGGLVNGYTICLAVWPFDADSPHDFHVVLLTAQPSSLTEFADAID
jgi:hypothetical protein